MSRKRPLTRFEKIGIILLAPILFVVAVIVAWNVAFHFIDKKSENRVANLASQLTPPEGCRNTKLETYKQSEEFGVSFHASLTYVCNQVPTANALADINKNLKTINYDVTGYSELDKKANYPDVRATFITSDKPPGEGGISISYQLQDTNGNTLKAQDRPSLEKFPVVKIQVEISL